MIARSRITSSEPNEFKPSAFASLRALCNSLSWFTRRIPFPPPPATALIISGYPTVVATEEISFRVLTIKSEPGIHGTPTDDTIFFACALLPIIFIECDFGPTKIKSFFSQAIAKSAFSERKP